MDSNTDCGPRLEVQIQRTMLMAHCLSLGFSGILRFHAFVSFYKKIFFIYVCASVCVYVYMCVHQESSEEGVRFPEAGLTGCWEPLRMDAGN